MPRRGGGGTAPSPRSRAPASEDGYYFSLAQTGAGESGWYGEDCLGEDSVCHEIASDMLSLACVAAVGDVEASVATLHCDHEATTTWAFWGGEGWETVVASGGDDPSYFEM